MRTIHATELPGLVGQEVAVSGWLEVGQERIGQFAEATGDRQWIHLDTERARVESPYGATIAHGFLTLSLLSAMASEALRVEGDFRLRVNYGFNRVRFPAPVVAGSRIRARFALNALREIEGGIETTWGVTVETEGGGKPCLSAEWITRAYR